MTFVKIQVPPTGHIIMFSLMAVAYLATCYFTALMGHAQAHYRSSIAIHYLFPLASLISCIENISLSIAGTVITDLKSFWLYILFALQACIVPILLNVTYEITYLVHKRRSVNFCGLFFDEGKRVKVIATPVRSFVLRNFIRILGVVLLATGIVANFDLLEEGKISDDNDDDSAGFAGWYSLYPWKGQVHLLLSLLPTMVLVFTSFYLSIVLWRYGTNSSMVVHSSVCNPWFSLFFGTLALGGGQCFGSGAYPVTSNLGFLIFVLAIILLMKEVDKDMAAAAEFTEFLAEVARMGNKISVRHSKPSATVAKGGEGGQHVHPSPKVEVEAGVISDAVASGTRSDVPGTRSDADKRNDTSDAV